MFHIFAEIRRNTTKFAKFLHLYINRHFAIPLGTIGKAATTATTKTKKDRILRLKKSNQICGN